MTPEELEDLAFRKMPMPDLRSQSQCLLFQAFRHLYAYAEMVKMAPEQGRREKVEILKAYQVNKMLEEMQEQTNEMWKRIELAASEYRRAPSVEKADKLLKAIYRTKRKAV